MSFEMLLLKLNGLPAQKAEGQSALGGLRSTGWLEALGLPWEADAGCRRVVSLTYIHFSQTPLSFCLLSHNIICNVISSNSPSPSQDEVSMHILWYFILYSLPISM